MTQDKMKATGFAVTDKETGQVFRWSFWRDRRKPSAWMLKDHGGYVRTLAPTWIDSVPMINLIADNHGCSCHIS